MIAMQDYLDRLELCKKNFKGLSTRAIHALEDKKVTSMVDLLSYSTDDIGKFRNIGKKTKAEIELYIKNKGFQLDISPKKTIEEIKPKVKYQNPFDEIIAQLSEVRNELSDLRNQNIELKELLLNIKEQTATVDDELLTPKEVCAYLGINLSTRWRYEKDGKIKSERIGGKILYRKSELIKNNPQN